MAAVEEMCGVVGDEECEIAPTNKPRKRKTSVTKPADIKAQRTRGKEHVNHVGKIVPERVVGPDCRYVMSVSLSK
jgi:hypothetical protein